jgi:hypothetical protein
MKQRAPLPRAVIHDGLPAYDEVFKRELASTCNPRIMEVRSMGSNEKGLNPKVERLNGTVRDRETVMRSLDTQEAAQELVNALRIHYNFIRPNQAIGGQTPAEAAGIDIGLEKNKVKDLIMKSAEAKQERKREYNIEFQLGNRLKYLEIKRETDCVSVKPESWIPKSIWREINDILSINGFSWLENGRDSQWIKMNKQGIVSNHESH